MPKADYDKSESSPKEIRYGYLSEHKLKDIVMTKLTKHHSLHKSKEIMQMCSEENIEELNMSRERDKSVKLPPLMTPPIIVQTRAEQGGRMDVIMRIKEGDKQRRYDYNRPVWWG